MSEPPNKKIYVTPIKSTSIQSCLPNSKITVREPNLYIFKNAKTLSQCIDNMKMHNIGEIIESLDYLILELSHNKRIITDTTPHENDYVQQVQISIYRAMSMLFNGDNDDANDDANDDNNNDDNGHVQLQEDLDVYIKRTQVAVKLLRYCGWDFTNPAYNAELLGYYAIYRRLPYSVKVVMLKTYLELCDGRAWINREIQPPMTNNSYTTTLSHLCMRNSYYDGKIPRDMFTDALNYGASPNTLYEFQDGSTCLKLACAHPDGWLARQLLEHGAILNDKNSSSTVCLSVYNLQACNRKKYNGEYTYNYRVRVDDLDDARECCLAMLDHGLDILLPTSYIFEVYEQRIQFLKEVRERRERRLNRTREPEWYCDCIGGNIKLDECECSEYECECNRSDFGYSNDSDDDIINSGGRITDNYYNIERSVEYSYLNYGKHSSSTIPLWKFGDILLCQDEVVLGVIYRHILNRRIECHKITDDAEYLYWLLIIQLVLNEKIKHEYSYGMTKSILPSNIHFQTRLHNLIIRQMLDMILRI